MPPSPGTRLGPYEIIAMLGAGGMGEVYRARDGRLDRDVALKILPPALVGDPGTLARFEREAKTLAALNHPNIAQIYGLEESGSVRFLVMELVAGDTLAARIAKGPLPIDEALAIARQIAAALEAAHDRGIVHRDLKPANIALTGGGGVKVLDFGLAKDTTGSIDVDPANSPTIAAPVMSVAGVILGTAAYMAPEQARGKTVDRRADMWAFGCVLFEMLTGRQAFAGETVTDILAGVIHNDPEWHRLPAETPPRVQRLLRRCLAKDPSRRVRDAGDARLELDDVSADASGQRSTVERRPWTSAVMFAAGAMVAGAIAWSTSRRPPEPVPISRWTISLPADAPIDVGGPWSSLDLSRDGRTVLYIAATAEDRQIVLRRADDLTAHVLAGTSPAWEAFFSPDGQWVGFIAADRLKKVAVTGGQPVVIADTPNFNSGVWADDGTIYIGGRAGLAKVSADGTVTTILKPAPNEAELGAPDLLPDGSVLFTIKPNDVSSFDDARIAVVTPRGERKIVLEGGARARYSASGHLLFEHGGQIMAVPFDLAHLAVSGQPVAVVNGGAFDPAAGTAFYAVSRNGTLAYVPGGPSIKTRSMAWVDRHGGTIPIRVDPRFYAEPSISPDGRQIALAIRAANDDVWIYDVARGSFARLTFPHGNSEVPIWSPDGTKVVYALDRGGVRRLVWRAADGSGSEQPLTPAQYYQTPGSFSPDGTLLAYEEGRPDTAGDIFVMPVDGHSRPVPFAATRSDERFPRFSPDGRWIAYASDETGRFEVYAAPYPGPGRKLQISDRGGVLPAWRRDGKEIVYREGDRLMSVPIASLSPLQVGGPRELATLPPHTGYVAMAPSGDRFLAVYSDGRDQVARELTVVLNWFEDLRTRVPVH